MTLQHSHTPHKRYFVLTDSGASAHTALATDTLDRLEVFSNHLRLEPVVITLTYHNQLQSALRQRHLNTAIQHIPAHTIYETFCAINTDDIPEILHHDTNQDGGRHVQHNDGTQGYFHYSSGVPSTYVHFGMTQESIQYIDHLAPIAGRITPLRREWYDQYGYLSAVETRDSVTPTQTFFDRGGKIRLTSNSRKGRSTACKAFAHNEHGMTTHIFNDMREVIGEALQRLANRYADDELYFIVEDPLYYQGLRKVKHPHKHIISIVDILHSTAARNTKKGSAVRDSYAAFDCVAELQNAPEQHIVVSSKQEQQTIVSAFGASHTVHVIPPFDRHNNGAANTEIATQWQELFTSSP